MNKILIIISLLFFLPAKKQDNTAAFMAKLSRYCGKSFAGTAIFPEGDRNPFKGQALKVIFASCSPTEIRMPFHVGEDKSRTWILTVDEMGLLFKHDHRHEDGTPDEITMYGGYASTDGTALTQRFPADEYTAKLIPAASTNEWSFVLDEEKQVLSYILKRDGQLRFHAEFDLSKVL
ncbi:MAG TPA: hypothetical protein PKC24_04335 [Cyclobacteriaceae bacterium]|nr:hypothetical protein [Cyclobacteriaceae bacterium]